ncbi:MAG: hypothetical protein V1755_15485 [Chloroflexota bacterium]
MRRRWWALSLCVIVIGVLLLLAPSLDELDFKPARSFASALDPARPIVLPALSVPEDTPISTILLFWLALVVGLVVFFLFLPSHLRRRILRQLVSYAVSVLAFVLAWRYGILRWPDAVFEAPAEGRAGMAVSTAPTDLQAFQPPRVAPWMTYGFSLALLWLILLAIYLLYR